MKIFENNDKEMHYGIVTSIMKGVSKNGHKQYRVTLSDNDNEKDFLFTDRDRNVGMATRFEGRNVRPGSVVVVNGTKSANGEYLMANSISYARGRHIVREGENEITVLIGIVNRPHDFEKGFSVRIPCDEWDPKKKERVTKWYDVAFFDESSIAEAKSICNDKSFVAIVCDSFRQTLRNGFVNESYVGHKTYPIEKIEV